MLSKTNTDNKIMTVLFLFVRQSFQDHKGQICPEESRETSIDLSILKGIFNSG